MNNTLLALGFFDTIILFMFFCMVPVVIVGVVLSKSSAGRGLAGKAAGGAARLALGQVVKVLRR